jgi:hypothetical protein
VLDYIESQGQVLGYYTNELRARGYDKALCFLPHDGVNTSAITGLRYADHLRDAGFDVSRGQAEGVEEQSHPCLERRQSSKQQRRPAARKALLAISSSRQF